MFKDIDKMRFDNIVNQFNFGSLMNQLTVNKENDFFTLTYDKYTFHIYFTDNVQIAVLCNDDVIYMQTFEYKKFIVYMLSPTYFLINMRAHIIPNKKRYMDDVHAIFFNNIDVFQAIFCACPIPVDKIDKLYYQDVKVY